MGGVGIRVGVFLGWGRVGGWVRRMCVCLGMVSVRVGDRVMGWVWGWGGGCGWVWGLG